MFVVVCVLISVDIIFYCTIITGNFGKHKNLVKWFTFGIGGFLKFGNLDHACSSVLMHVLSLHV